MIGALYAVFRRDLLLAGRAGGGATGVAFLLALATLIPFAVGPDLALLTRIGPAIIWVGALLSMLLGLDRLFAADNEDGSLDLLRAGAHPLEAIILAKCAAHWLAYGLPLVVASPLLGLLYALDAGTFLPLALSLLIGTPALALLGGIGAATTVSARRGALLLPLLILPLSTPILIFGVAASQAPAWQPFALLAATTLAALALAPFAAAAALRIAGE